jgi:hypothetical protein
LLRLPRQVEPENESCSSFHYFAAAEDCLHAFC